MLMLNVDNVQAILEDCLFRDNEPIENEILVDGIFNNFAFHPERVKQHRKEIMQLLLQLPEEFLCSKSSGASFHGACLTRNMTQWGEPINAEQLLCLGMAIKAVTECEKVPIWSIIVGAAPFYQIHAHAIPAFPSDPSLN